VTSAEKYVAAAYLVVFLTLLVYVVIIASKLARLESALTELVEQVRTRG
jgi:CcmD family protein